MVSTLDNRSARAGVECSVLSCSPGQPCQVMVGYEDARELRFIHGAVGLTSGFRDPCRSLEIIMPQSKGPEHNRNSQCVQIGYSPAPDT